MNFNPSIAKLMENLYNKKVENQFEIVDLTKKHAEDDKIENIKLEKRLSTIPSTSGNVNVKMMKNQENSQNPIDKTICDEMIHRVLEESNALNDFKTINALKIYSDSLKQYLLIEDDPNSQATLLLRQVDVVLNKMLVSSVNEDARTQKNADLRDVTKILQIKKEPIVMDIKTASHVKSNGIQDSVIKDSNQLKIYAMKAQQQNGNFTETNQTLLECVFESREDLDNGHKKLSKSLKNIITLNAALLMEVDGKDDEIENAKELKKSSKSKHRFSRELAPEDQIMTTSIISDDTAMDADEESDYFGDNSDDDGSDDSVSRLIDLSSLRESDKKNFVNQSKIPKKEMKKRTKKEKDCQNDSYFTCDSDSDVDSLPSNFYDTDDNYNFKVSEMSDEENEEEILKQKIESKAREELLQSSDEETFKLSSSSSLDTSDEERNKDENRTHVNENANNDEFASSGNETDEIAELIGKSASIDDSGTENENKEKYIKLRRRNSFEREIFDPKFLDSESELESTDDERIIQKSPIRKKSAIQIVDLEEYFEKRAADLEAWKNCEPSTSKGILFEPLQNVIADGEISSKNVELLIHPKRRKQLTHAELRAETRKAKRDEQERVKKLEEKNVKLSQFLTQRLSQSDDINPLVLDHSEEKNLEIVVHPHIVKQLKDHQIDGIKFMYNK